MCIIIITINTREERDRQGMYRVWGRGEACTGIRWGNLKERDHLRDPGVNCEDNIKMEH
jgi:hypothetical protein